MASEPARYRRPARSEVHGNPEKEDKDKDNATTEKPSSSPRAGGGKSASKDHDSLTVTDILRITGGILLLLSLISYFLTSTLTFGYHPWWTQPRQVARWWAGPVALTPAELATYDGHDPSRPIYLALNGTIYDVTAGRRIYGPGGSYHVFAGADAARGFVTGCFREDRTADLRGVEEMFVPREPTEEERGRDGFDPAAAPALTDLSPAERKKRRELEYRLARKQVAQTIEGWARVFRGETGKPYFEVGRVVREEGWLEREPRKGLCGPAEQSRPVRGLGGGKNRQKPGRA